MNTTFPPISTLIVGSILSLGTLSCWPATAAILTRDFTFQPTQVTRIDMVAPGDSWYSELSPPFSPYIGSFSYDDSLINGIGLEVLDISSTFNADFPILASPLHHYGANAIFQDGNLVRVTNYWDYCQEVIWLSGCFIGGNFGGYLNSQSSLWVMETYINGEGFKIEYLGNFSLGKPEDVKIPEPSLILGLAGLSMVGLFTRRKNISKFADQ